MENRRRHPRTPLKAKIRLSSESFGELLAETEIYQMEGYSS